MGESGFVEGQNVTIEYRWALGQYGQLPAMAAEFVRRPVSIIVATGGEPAALAAQAATSTIPIIFAIGGVLSVKDSQQTSSGRAGTPLGSRS